MQMDTFYKNMNRLFYQLEQFTIWKQFLSHCNHWNVYTTSMIT